KLDGAYPTREAPFRRHGNSRKRAFIRIDFVRTAQYTKLHNAELHTLYSSPDIITNIKSSRLRWAGQVAHKGESICLSVCLSEEFICDNAGEMSPGSSTESYPAFAQFGLRENPRKNLNQREEQRLRVFVFENKVLRKIFGAKKHEVTGEWRKSHNAELHALFSSPEIIRNIKSRRLRWAGHVACMGEFRNAYSVLVRKPEGKIPLGRPRCRWEDNIKMDMRGVGYDDRDWNNLAQDRDQWRAYVKAAMNLRVP
ncbi:hypothetical protein ANN_20644, partial [Periplaneta americana]